MPDTKEQLQQAFEFNRRMRDEAEGAVRQHRDELERLLVTGQKAGMTVLEMARLAGISRETAHKLLRRAADG